MDIFFDLDGTLTDSGLGISRCLQHALAALGRPIPSAEVLRRFVGPPLHDTFAELLGTQEDGPILEAVRLYRERFVARGMFENEVYPGVPSGLGTLRRAGHRLWVVTAKPHVYASMILRHFGLGAWFEGVYGSERSTCGANKADLIQRVLECEGISASRAWMVGDRIHDIQGARRHAVGAVAVLWGYGTVQELLSAQPDRAVASMAELCEFFAAQRRLATDGG